ncbi:MAG: hypothetical protein ACYDB7_04095 [Mycobacteriales bacterium]
MGAVRALTRIAPGLAADVATVDLAGLTGPAFRTLAGVRLPS